MKNEFIELIKKAIANKWCIEPECTTCGSMEFRQQLKVMAGQDGEKLTEILAAMNIEELTSCHGWDRCIRQAYQFIRKPEQGDKILRCWLPELKNNLRLGDVVIYYIIRKGILFSPMSMEVRNKWIDACATYAVEFKNSSLLETLLYTIGTDVKKYDGFYDVVKELSDSDPKLKKALLKVGA